MIDLTSERIVITGGSGFLGWHLRTRLHALGCTNVVSVGREEWSSLQHRLADVGVVFHLAGVNRGLESELETMNARLARDLIEALDGCAPKAVVYANSIHSSTGTAYGRGKVAAGDILSSWCDARGVSFSDVRLPNLFGEHGRPSYNSFVATFVETVVNGEMPVLEDRPISLMHSQVAAEILIAAADLPDCSSQLADSLYSTSVGDVWNILKDQFETYSDGTIPDISSSLRRDLFNCLRARMFLDRPVIPLEVNADARGRFVETSRALLGESQSSYSTTVPGATRGNHYHLRKVERFVVISGSAEIEVSKMFSKPAQAVRLRVDGENPAAVDMPTGWNHKITNVGDDVLVTQFWTSELYNGSDPDTFFPEARVAGTRN